MIQGSLCLTTDTPVVRSVTCREGCQTVTYSVHTSAYQSCPQLGPKLPIQTPRVRIINVLMLPRVRMWLCSCSSNSQTPQNSASPFAFLNYFLKACHILIIVGDDFMASCTSILALYCPPNRSPKACIG